jgi:hypothetical protein
MILAKATHLEGRRWGGGTAWRLNCKDDDKRQRHVCREKNVAKDARAGREGLSGAMGGGRRGLGRASGDRPARTSPVRKPQRRRADWCACISSEWLVPRFS